MGLGLSMAKKMKKVQAGYWLSFAAGLVCATVGTHLYCRDTESDVKVNESGRESVSETQELFKIASGVLRHWDSESRVNAASRLAKRKEGEAWVIVMLLDEIALYNFEVYKLPPEQFERVRNTVAPPDRGVIGALLEHVPRSASPALLWAVTEWLEDSERGTYSKREGLPPLLHRQIDLLTEPMRDLARNALKRALRVDHEYDKVAWRRAILDHRWGQE